MEQVTLPSGIWTRIYKTTCFQSKSNQTGVRIHYGATAPATNTDLYFVTQEFDLKPFVFPDVINGLNIYLMPDEDQAIDIVVF